MKTFQDGWLKIVGSIMAVESFGQHINEHAGGRSLQVVSFARPLVHDLVPQAAAGFLVFQNACTELSQGIENLRPRRVIGGKPIQRVDQRHSIPPRGPAPKIG